MRKVRVLILCFAIMALCGCEISKGNSSTEYSGESSTSKEDTGTDLDQGEIPPIEETMPFSIASDAKIYKYESNNLLGLCAIYVNAPSEVIYVFDLKKDFVKFSNQEGFQVYGKDSGNDSFRILNYSFAKDDYRQYVMLKCEERYEIEGFYFIKNNTDFQYELNDNAMPVVIEYENGRSSSTSNRIVITSRQTFNIEKQGWDNVEQSTEEVQYREEFD
ncbi:MAG: hypothetical protein IK081_14155 [Lachnospiraceae bacterium]|nr:hypothetical protein [Lachnospiraceae bacterium]